LQASARGRAWRVRFARVRLAVVRLQAAYRRSRIEVIARQLLADARMFRAGTVFIKFNDLGKPRDRLVWLSQDLLRMHWVPPHASKYNLAPHRQIALADMQAVDDQLKFGLIKKIIEQLKGFEGKESGITSLKPKSCFAIVADARTLDLQAQSKQVKAEWAAALRLLLAFRQSAASLRTLDARAKFVQLVEDRQLVQQAVVAKRKHETITRRLMSTFTSFHPHHKKGVAGSGVAAPAAASA